ncbi:MAG: MBL fold metallo-hydrolase [Planctomycetota bacterium]
MPLLSAVCLVAAALPQDAASSPLLARTDACARGAVLLTELRDHLVPPRHRAYVEVEARVVSLVHGARPDVRRTVDEVRGVGLHDVGDQDRSEWHIRSSERDPAREDGELRTIDLARGEVRGADGNSAGARLRARLTRAAPYPYVALDWVERSGRVVDLIDGEHGPGVLVAVPGGRVLARTIVLDHDGVEFPGLVGFDWWIHDDLLGDVVEALTYAPEPSPAPGVAPGWRIEGPLGTGEEATVVEVSETWEIPALIEPGPLFPPSEVVEARVEPLGRDTYEILLPGQDARVLALALDIGWVVLEAPVSSEVGEAILRSLEEERPGLRVRYVAVSHHHPHYIGGLRPFVARGATIVCPSDIEAYVEYLVMRPRTLVPDALTTSHERPEFIGVEPGEHWSIPSLEDRLVAIEADGRSAHTEAFLTFVLPDLAIGFGGDILWIPEDPEIRRRSPRTAGLAAILESGGIPVETYYTSWPVTREPLGGIVWRDSAPLADIEAARSR